jgi:hypothetical protein
MNFMLRRRTPAALVGAGLGLTLVAGLAWAPRALATDLVLSKRVTVTTEGATNAPAPQETTEYLTSTKTVSDDPNMRTIVDLEAKTYTIVDKTRKTYSVATLDEIRERGAEMRKRLAQLPGGAPAGLSGNQPAAKPTGRKETIAGYQAEEITVENGPMSTAVWMSTDLERPASNEAWKQFSESLSAMQGPAGALAAALSETKGVPLKVVVKRSAGPARMTAVNEVTAVKKASPPPDILKVPAGYAKVESPLLAPPPQMPPGGPPGMPPPPGGGMPGRPPGGP